VTAIACKSPALRAIDNACAPNRDRSYKRLISYQVAFKNLTPSPSPC